MPAAIALVPVGLWVRARRWAYLFPPRAHPPGLVPAVMIGYMVNNILPLRAGEVVRVYVVAHRWGGHFWLTLATLVVERVLDGLAIVTILGVLVLLIPVPGYLKWGGLVLLAVNLTGVAALVLLATVPRVAERMLEGLLGRWPRLRDRGLGILRTFAQGLEGIRTPAHLLPLAAWSAVVWVVPALGAWTVLLATGLDLPFVAAWAVLAFLGLGLSIPSAPGHIGVFHAAAALALVVFGVPQAAAVGYAILLHASQYLPQVVLGWIYLLREHVSLGEATHARPPIDEPTPR
jgi:uncharacterized protein (TIRG00374 family)